MAAKEGARGGIGFPGMLTVLFIGLKLAGVIDWSWLLVLLPLYGMFALLLFVFLVLALVYGIACLLDWE